MSTTDLLESIQSLGEDLKGTYLLVA